jgi:hypothetical protein
MTGRRGSYQQIPRLYGSILRRCFAGDDADDSERDFISRCGLVERSGRAQHSWLGRVDPRNERGIGLLSQSKTAIASRINCQQIASRILLTISAHRHGLGKVRPVRLEAAVGEHLPRAINAEDWSLRLPYSPHDDVSTSGVREQTGGGVRAPRLAEHADSATPACRLRDAEDSDGEGVSRTRGAQHAVLTTLCGEGPSRSTSFLGPTFSRKWGPRVAVGTSTEHTKGRDLWRTALKLLGGY